MKLHNFMNSKITKLLLISTLASSSASAAYTFYSNRSTWEAALGAITTESFNSFGADTNAVLTPFNGFTITSGTGANNGVGGTNVMVDVPAYDQSPGSATIDGTPRLNFIGITAANLTFYSPVAAAGFDAVNYDSGGDEMSIFVNNEITPTGFFPLNNQDIGFWGIISDSGADISGLNFTGPAFTYNAIDNVSFVAEVPFGVDSTLGLGLLGAAAAFKFRRRRKA